MEFAEAVFAMAPNHGRPAHLRIRCEEWIETKLREYSCTTSRDGETRYLPFRVKGSFLWNLFVVSEGDVVSQETVRLAFNNVIATWGKPRFKSECKSCRFCWENF